jgi:hypothetical protein
MDKEPKVMVITGRGNILAILIMGWIAGMISTATIVTAVMACR